MPSPPCARSSDRVSCTNRSKTRASSSGAHARAVVAHLHHRLAVLDRRRASVMCPPTSVYFAALLSRFANTWTMRVGSASSGSSSLRQRQRQLLPLLGDQRPADLDRLQQQRRPARRAACCSSILPWLTRDTSSRSSSSRFMCCTCRSMTARYVDRQLLVVGRRRVQDLDGVEDRRQRIAQLVRQHRQELVLAAIGLAQLLLGALALGDVLAGADACGSACRRRRARSRSRCAAAAPSRPAARCESPTRTARRAGCAAIQSAQIGSRSSGWMYAMKLASATPSAPGSNPSKR